MTKLKSTAALLCVAVALCTVVWCVVTANSARDLYLAAVIMSLLYLLRK
jgi:hypothetical protein